MSVLIFYKPYTTYTSLYMDVLWNVVCMSGRSARSVTSETPLTLDLSRSTSGVTTESPMPDSPPSYEEAMRHSPDGATAPVGVVIDYVRIQWSIFHYKSIAT